MRRSVINWNAYQLADECCFRLCRFRTCNGRLRWSISSDSCFCTRMDRPDRNIFPIGGAHFGNVLESRSMWTNTIFLIKYQGQVGEGGKRTLRTTICTLRFRPPNTKNDSIINKKRLERTAPKEKIAMAKGQIWYGQTWVRGHKDNVKTIYTRALHSDPMNLVLNFRKRVNSPMYTVKKATT